MQRDNRLSFAFAILLVLSVAGVAAAQQPPAPLVVRPLKGNVYWGQGGAGGNSGIIIGQNGVIVIDAKTTADSAKELLAEIAKLTPKPVTYVIVTHSDGDHINGLAAFPKGVKVIAHENAKKEIDAALKAGGRGAPPPDALPTQVVAKNKESLKIEGVNLTLLHWAPAHTSGDLVISIPAEKLVFTGDIVATQRPEPFIHVEKNGTSEGWIETAKGVIGLNAETYVPGHGDLQTKADLQKLLAASVDKRDKVKAFVAQGKSIEEIKTALGYPAPPAGRGGAAANTWADVIYQELTKKKS